MSLNLGNDAMKACEALRANPDFQRLLAAIGPVVGARIELSLEVEPNVRVDATAYARGMRDVWVALQAATDQIQQRMVDKTKMRVPNV